MTDYDMEILAKTIFGEARGESQEGQIAVACCILNRFKSKKWFSSNCVAGVCLKPWQFSCWNKNDPNSQKIMHLSYSTYSKYFPIIKLAQERDITDGATHYYNPNVCATPKWAEDKTPCAEIGAHLFFKDIE
jgi:spore germination cell wall hydrolase CwlJ-like protein